MTELEKPSCRLPRTTVEPPRTLQSSTPLTAIQCAPVAQAEWPVKARGPFLHVTGRPSATA